MHNWLGEAEVFRARARKGSAVLVSPIPSVSLPVSTANVSRRQTVYSS